MKQQNIRFKDCPDCKGDIEEIVFWSNERRSQSQKYHLRAILSLYSNQNQLQLPCQSTL